MALTILGLTLLSSAIIDFRTGRLPDVLTLAVAAICVLVAETGGRERLFAGVIAAAVSFGLLQVIRGLFARIKGRQGLGFGDVKLIAALAIWLGSAVSWAVLGAAITGLGAALVLKPKDGRIAFGPMIAGASWIVGFGREAGWWLS